MKNVFWAEVSTVINAPRSKVWKALTDPAMVKKYLFGTTMKTDWNIGGPITYSGEWEGKKYEDKGIVLAFEPEELIETSYWSSFSGLPDLASNYQNVSYILSEKKGGIELKITQDNIATKEAAEHSEKNWKMVLKSIKDLLEK